MALKCTPENIRDEIRAGEEFRDKFLTHVKTLIERFQGNFYRADKRTDIAIVENHAYQFISLIQPSLVYDDPRCAIRAANPSQTDAMGLYNMGGIAKGLELFLNRWSEDSEVADPLTEGAVDFFFAWAIWLVTIADQPGYRGVELIPQRPYLMRLSPRDFLMDATAKTWNVMQHGGPRLNGHRWKADIDDLMSDPTYDPLIVEQLAADTDLDKYDLVRETGINVPNRREILAWDIWVPEKHLTSEPGYNGSIYTVAVANDPNGVSKRPQYLREPQPAYCPPWGPYVVAGAYKVPDCPFPLSPLVAVAEQADSANRHKVAIAESVADYKKIAYGKTSNPQDAVTAKNARHGAFVMFDDADGIGDVEIGGPSELMFEASDRSTDQLERDSGLSGAMRGTVEAGGKAPATTQAIAQQAGNMRINGLKRQWRKAVKRVFESAAWFGFYGEDVIAQLGEEGERYGITEYRGGIYPGQEMFNYFDLSLRIDPLSMEHTDQSMLQQNITMAMTQLKELIAIMPQAPFVEWREPITALFDALNIDTEGWFNFDILGAVQGIEQAAKMPEPDLRLGEGERPVEGAQVVPDMSGGPNMEPPVMQDMRQMAAVQAGAMGV